MPLTNTVGEDERPPVVSSEILAKLRQLAYHAVSEANPVVGRFDNDEECTLNELLVLYDIMGRDVFGCVLLEEQYDRRLNPASNARTN